MKSHWTLYPLLAAAAILVVLPLRAETIDGWEMKIRHPVRNKETHALLRQWLKQEDPALRIAGLNALARINDRADDKKIEALLTDPDARVRIEAIRAAARVGLSLSTARARSLAGDPEPLVRRAFYTRLAALGDAIQGALLERGLEDAHPGVRSAAGKTAAGRPELRKTMWSLLNDEASDLVQQAWYEALLANTPPPRPELLDWGRQKGGAFNLILMEHIQSGDTDMKDTVLDWFNHPVKAVAETAMQAAARAGWDAAVPVALAQLPDAGAMRKMSLISMLRHFEQSDTVTALYQIARHDEDRLLAIAAGQVLTAWKSEAATRALLQLVPKGHMDVRIIAVQELGHRRFDDAATTLYPLLHEESPYLLASVLQTLVQLKHSEKPQHLETFRQLTESGHGGIKAGAFRLLGQLDDREVLAAFTNVLTNIAVDDPFEPRLAAWEVLRQWSEQGSYDLAMEFVTFPVLPPLPFMLEPRYDEDPVRFEALGYLLDFRKPETPEELLEGLKDTPSPRLRVRLAEALTDLTGKKYMPLPDYTYERWRVESLKPVAWRHVTAPGVQLESP